MKDHVIGGVGLSEGRSVIGRLPHIAYCPLLRAGGLTKEINPN